MDIAMLQEANFFVIIAPCTRQQKMHGTEKHNTNVVPEIVQCAGRKLFLQLCQFGLQIFGNEIHDIAKHTAVAAPNAVQIYEFGPALFVAFD